MTHSYVCHDALICDGTIDIPVVRVLFRRLYDRHQNLCTLDALLSFAREGHSRGQGQCVHEGEREGGIEREREGGREGGRERAKERARECVHV